MMVNLLRAHGTIRRYNAGCRCDMCRRGNAVHVKSYNDAWRESHREEARDYHRSWMKNWRAAHPGKNAEHQRRSRLNRRDQRSADYAIYRSRLLGNGGTHTGDDVSAQYERQRGLCYWCKTKLGDCYQTDHVVPLALGGSNGIENLVVACPPCNQTKNAKHPMDFAGVMF